jgi:anti-sigma B factor antagonist
MATNPLSIEESHRGEVCVVALSGRIDSTNAEELMGRLNALLSSGETNVLVDLKGVIYLTSAAFRALLVAADEAERKAARFVLCSVLGQVRELFEMGGLLDAFTIHASRDEALERLS